MTTPLALASVVTHPLDDVFVFHDRPLRDHVDLADTARFGDDVWPLAPATLQRHERGLVLNFTTVSARYRLAAKLVCYTLLSGALPAGETRPSITSILGIFYKIRTFVTWLEHRPVRPPHPSPQRICELTGADLEDFQRHLLATFTNAQYRLSHRSAVRYLWRLRQVLGEYALPFDPHHVTDWGEGSGGAAVENTTDRIPEQVHAPLLVWAMRFVDEFGPDILSALNGWQALRGPTGASSRVGRGRNTGLAADLRRYLDDHLTQHQPLPGHQGKPNIHAIALAVRCSTRPLELQYRDQIDAVVAKVGITPYTRVNIPIGGRLDGQPWLDGIAVEPNADNGMPTLARMLQAACYVVIAFLSGMRDCEKRAELHLMQHSAGWATTRSRRSWTWYAGGWRSG